MENVTMERIKAVMKEKNITKAELARRSGINNSSLSDYFKGNYNIKQDKVYLIAQALHVSPAWLMGFDEKPSRAIPVLGRVAAGIPIEAVQDIEDYEELEECFGDPREYFALHIKGQSMEPRIPDGSRVIVHKQEDVDNGSVAVVLVNGNEATVKQIKKTPDGIMLIPFNIAVYTPHFYSNKEIQELPVRIIGKVVEGRQRFD